MNKIHAALLASVLLTFLKLNGAEKNSKDGYYANADNKAITGEGSCELNVTDTVTRLGSFEAWGDEHCAAPANQVCGMYIVSDKVVAVYYGVYE